MNEYLGVAMTAALAFAVAAGMTLAAMLFGPRKRTPVKGEPFECGMPPAQETAGRAPVNFYLVAILFVMFDVEVIFLYPWAVAAKGLGAAAFASMAVFILVLLAALYYAVRRGALEWD